MLEYKECFYIIRFRKSYVLKKHKKRLIIHLQYDSVYIEKKEYNSRKC